MKNLYKILGLDKNVTEREIKKAYRRLALEKHVDRNPGVDPEEMVKLNLAYEVLMDSEKRKLHDDEILGGVDDFSDDEANTEPVAGFLSAHGSLNSDIFRAEHAALYKKYQKDPLAEGSAKSYLHPFKSECYQLKNSINHNIVYNDVFSFIKEKANVGIQANASTAKYNYPLTVPIAVKLFTQFLEGKYYGQEILRLRGYFSKARASLRSNSPYDMQIAFYEGILDILSMQQNEALVGIKKITDYACKVIMYEKNTLEHSFLTALFSLLQNKYYRNLLSQALYHYWVESDDIFSPKALSHFYAKEALKSKIDHFRNQQSRIIRTTKTADSNLTLLIRYLQLLYKFEKQMEDSNDIAQNAEALRRQGYNALDWMEAFSGLASTITIINIIIQAGICFQRASICEKNAFLCMADEQLALKLYLQAFYISKQYTPNAELYVATHLLKYTTQFKFQEKTLPEKIKMLQNNALTATNIFPLFIPEQSNVECHFESHKILKLIGAYLHSLAERLEINLFFNRSLEICYDDTTVFYQNFLACLKDWYESDSGLRSSEEYFRLMLMEALLRKNNWNFSHIEQNTDAFGIGITRDAAGWIEPSRTLPMPPDEKVVYYSRLNGIIININTGDIKLQLIPWISTMPRYEALFTLADIQEIFERQIDNGFFSLDPVDSAQMHYHPFNLMRFHPTSMVNTQLLHSMLMTDYLLKFLTVGVEVQGRYPYALRSIEQITNHLPAYLKKIITDFHQAEHAGSLHRFWIESREISIADHQEDDLIELALGEIKMIVKKHAMRLNEEGEIVDEPEPDEGWHIYVLTPAQQKTLATGYHAIKKPALIFLENYPNYVYFLETDTSSSSAGLSPFEIISPSNDIMQLSELKRDESGKIINDFETAELLYSITKEIAIKSGKLHHFSPEYIFAREFTIHYDEFAQYYPEFGQLRELSRIIAIVPLLKGIYKNYLDKEKVVTTLLGNKNHWSNLANEITATIQSMKQDYKKQRDAIIFKVTPKLKQQFAEWKLQIDSLFQEHQQRLQEMRNQIGDLSVERYSTEVTEAYNRIIEVNKQKIIQEYGDFAWEQNKSILFGNESTRRQEIADQLYTLKQQNYYQQLQMAFDQKLSHVSINRRQYMYNAFLDHNNIDLLAQALTEIDKQNIIKSIRHNNFPKQSTTDILNALNESHNHHSETISWLAEVTTDTQLFGEKQAIDKNISQLENVENQQKEKLQKEQYKINRLLSRYGAMHWGTKATDDKLTNTCLWVPASYNHISETGRTRFVYGGVLVAPRTVPVQSGTPMHQAMLSQAANSSVHVVLGGSYNQVRAANIGGEVHHMPAQSNLPGTGLSAGRGSAIWMTQDDHRGTGSWGNYPEARVYRAAQADLVQQGKIRDAIAMDIKNVRSLYGTRYNNAMQQMLKYTHEQSFTAKPNVGGPSNGRN